MGTRTFTHVYPDDAADPYTLAVVVFDTSFEGITNESTIRVRNAAPTGRLVTPDAEVLWARSSISRSPTRVTRRRSMMH